jgi:predicted ATPase/class 3 adenylate cyclase
MHGLLYYHWRRDAVSALPTGTVTFLFTDIEGSTRLWEQRTAEMKVALARHDQILRHAIESSQGYVFKTVGDAFCAAFDTAMDGLHAALDAQGALVAEPWNVLGGIKVRMGLHTGAAEERDHDYFGQALNRTARLFSTGAGGQVLVSLVTAELLRDALPEGVGLRDLGAHRLKDLMRPESIFQVVAPGLRSDFPPLKSLDNHPNNFPMQPNPFIGREKELVSASRTILGDACRVLTLTGVGGTGKTRLALQVAANLTEQFPEGAYFVDLSAIDSPSFVLPAIARTLGLQISGDRSALEVLRDALKERSMLLVLDNFEQVMRGVANVVELLSACPMLKIIVTSREALHIRAEKVLPIPPLSAPKVRGAHQVRLAQLGQYESVSLFIERAGSVRPGFSVTNETAPAIAEICARLDGLPLAIELAAARVTTLTPQAILEKLGSRLRLLTGGPADLPFRQRTLRATIDWSYRMLSPGEQMLFRELSVFCGGASFRALEKVCACAEEGIDVLETLSSLVGKSLVWRVEQPDGEPRFQTYETMREYAHELLSGHARAALRTAHAEFFLHFAEANEGSLRGPKQRESFDRYDGEHDNFQAALDWLNASGSVESEMRLCVALTPLYQVRDFLVEGLHNLERAARRLDQASPALRGKVLLCLARLAESQHRYREALDLLDRSQRDLETGRDHSAALWIEYERGWCDYKLNLQEQAIAHYQAVLAGTAGSDLHLHAMAEMGIGASKTQLGELEDAQKYLERAKAVFTSTGDDRSLVRAILEILMISYSRENFTSALRSCMEALEVQQRLNDHYSLPICLNNLGCLHLLLGQHAEAQQAYRRLIPLAERSANRRLLMWGLAGIAESELRIGEVAQAEADALKAVAIARTLDAPFDLGVALRVLAEVHDEQGRHQDALDELSRCLPLVEKGGDVVELRKTTNALDRVRARIRGGPGEDSPPMMRAPNVP